MQTTVNDKLVELGTLVYNTDTAIQRSGVEMVEGFFNTHNEGDNVDVDTIAQLLYYLTDIQVRDYALGILNPSNPVPYITALNLLLEKAPTDTQYISAPAALLAVIYYEINNKEEALTVLTNAQDGYPLALLLSRVFAAGFTPEGFATMRADLHHKVVEGIYKTKKVGA
tara:strand:+ start:211 stop:717 length:507 start_codon:yes stop_codon:yes gene_type:complete